MYKKKHQNIKTLLGVITLASFLSFSGTASALNANALPKGGKITYGKGSISTSGRKMTVKQSTQKMIADWKTFNIGTNAGVTFRQPNSDAVALNKIYDQNPSLILGSLRANGNIFLINPSGIVFGEGAQVNVGGLVASTLKMRDKDFITGRYTFLSNGNAGSVINQGNINARTGGVVALIGPSVINEGNINAESGDVLLAAGNQVTLDFKGDGLISYTINKGAVDALVENSGYIQADGGLVVMTAKAADSLTQAVVNNSGVIEAQTLKNKEGRIMLMSDMENGTIIVGGTLDATAPNGGNGGFIETSGNSVKVSDGAIITTLAPQGKIGTWQIDPYDFTVAASGGDVTGSALTTALASNNVTIQTLAGSVVCTGATCGSGTAAGNGDIFVNDNITWLANTLTLNAYRNININKELFGSGTAQLALLYGQGAVAAGNTATYSIKAPVNLPAGYKFFTMLGSDGPVKAYYVITSLGAAGSMTTTDLQGMSANLSGYYALGSNIDATATSTWNAGLGFAPIGDSSTRFTGQFDGLGHTISNLTINRPSQNYIGLFGYTGSGSAVSNIGLIGGSVNGQNAVGGLVGYNYGNISNSYATGSVSGTTNDVGGLVGYNAGGTVTNSYATGSVSGTTNVGGLVGYNSSGTVTNAYAMGSVSGTTYVGGLVGRNIGTVTNSYAMGSVSGTTYVGGLVGYYDSGSITNSYATGSVSGTNAVGGLVGYNAGGTVTNSYWDTITSGTSTGIGGGTLTGATGRTTTQMMQTANFSGWDFTNTWFLIPGNTRPFLRMEYSTNITNAHQLQLMAMNLGASYTLGANIDMSELTNPSGMWGTQSATILTGITTGFSPIGSSSPQFTGQFDGLGHTITNLTINRPSQDFVGLFGYAGSGSAVRNVGLVGGSISGTNFVGGLVGYNYSGTVTNTYATGSVTGSGGSYFVGGLVGGNVGTISNSYATGIVSGASQVGGLVGYNGGTITNSYATGIVSSDYVGGLVGYNGGTITNSYATGIVSGTYYVGGLAGLNGNGGTISNSYATGSVSGSNNVGGLVGVNTGSTITNSYATGSVSGSNNVGGLVGFNTSSSTTSSTISNSYATGIVSGASQVGGLAGWNEGGTVTNSYWDTITSGTSTGIGGGTLTGATGRTTTQMMQTANFSGWDFTNTWFLIPGNTRPFLRMEYSTNIINAHQLQLMAMNLGANYTLGANIDMAEIANPSGMWGTQSATILTGITTGFVPIGDSSTPFTGHLDGMGHTITNLTINRPYDNNIGLFGFIGSSGAVSNVGLVGGSVTGNQYVGGLIGFSVSGSSISNSYATGSVIGWSGSAGGLVGWNSGGTITNSYATGSVLGMNYVGGLIGYNYSGTITNSYATGSISNTGSYVGGLVGANGGTITNSYATGSIDGGYQYAGGLAGVNSGSISNAYATGSVSVHGSDVGGLAGRNTNTGSITDSYWDTQTTGQAYAVGLEQGTTAATGLTTAHMMDTTYMPGLNFTTTWWLSPGNTRPFLRMEHSTNIINAHQLQLMAMYPAESYTLGADINMAELTNPSGMWNTTKGFVPMGNYTTPFTGTFDGQDHTITNLTINRPSQNYVGLFGYIGSGGTVSNVGLVGGSVTGKYEVGELVGWNSGTVSKSYATGSASGIDDVGGLAGGNFGTISNTYATGNVSGIGYNYYIGGLVGYNSSYGTISFSYATGIVTGSNNVGGLVGYNNNSTGGAIDSNFWDKTTSGTETGIGGGYTSGATGKTTTEMQTAATFTSAGWSNDIWNIANGSYPTLK